MESVSGVSVLRNIFVVQSDAKFWEGAHSSVLHRSQSAVKPCAGVVMARRSWLNGKLAFSLPGWQPCAGLPL